MRTNFRFQISDFRLNEALDVQSQIPNRLPRRAFTLTELMIVILIIGIMAGLALSALSGATELAREQRTRAIIAKLDNLIAEKWEGYRTRAVPLRIAPNVTLPTGVTRNTFVARMRLYALRDLMRMELPDRVTDVSTDPATLNSSPSIQVAKPSSLNHYRRIAQRNCGASWATAWTEQNQGSECLYLIVSNMHDGDKNALDFFLPGEIGDTDGDKMLEILDGWGRPIEFLRWAPGYTVQNKVPTMQDTTIPDPFDPLKCDPRWSDSTVTIKPFALYPLICSAGRDKQQDISILATAVSGFSGAFKYSTTTPVCDPYYGITISGQVLNGAPMDFDSDGNGAIDNITNHYLATP